MSEAALRERIDELEEEVRQLREQKEDAQLVLRCMAAFDIPRRHAAILVRLMRSVGISHYAFETIGDGSLKVYIHGLRRKLHPKGVFIDALWGQGYRMTPENRERARAIVEAVE